jgi:hypothetical protein
MFIDIPVIGVSLSSLHQVVEENGSLRTSPVEPDQLTDRMVLLEQVAITPAIVISQSCDAERAPRLMLAPLSGFKLDEKEAEKKWKKISHAATSLGEPKNIYLPGNPALGISRSLADFGLAFTLPREFLVEVAKRGKRTASLSEHAVAFLQFRLGVLLTRLAQDDFAWPSKEDLEIRIQDLTEQIAKAEKKTKKTADADKASGDERESLMADLTELDEEIAYLKSTKEQATAALATADELK